MIEKEIAILFINTLKEPYYDKMMGNATKNFANLVISREMIENGVKSGRIRGTEVQRRENVRKKKKKLKQLLGEVN